MEYIYFQMIQSQSTEAGRLHCEFVDCLHRDWFHTEGHAPLSHMTTTRELPGLFRSLTISMKGGGDGSKKATPKTTPTPPRVLLPQLIKQHFQKVGVSGLGLGTGCHNIWVLGHLVCTPTLRHKFPVCVTRKCFSLLIKCCWS